MSILFLIVLNSQGNAITSSTARFTSEVKCLQAIEKILDMEKKFGVKIQARCVNE